MLLENHITIKVVIEFTRILSMSLNFTLNINKKVEQRKDKYLLIYCLKILDNE